MHFTFIDYNNFVLQIYGSPKSPLLLVNFSNSQLFYLGFLICAQLFNDHKNKQERFMLYIYNFAIISKKFQGKKNVVWYKLKGKES